MKRILILLAVSLPGLILMAGCSGAGSYPDGDSRYEAFAPDGIPFVVADSTWAIDQRGNHRAVVTVAENSGEGVLVELPWRRPDLNPETKKILVTDAEDKEIKDVVVTKLTPEEGEIIFKPELGPKARCVPHDNNLALSHNDLGWDLEEILRANPYHTATREYAGAHFLLAKNLQGFNDFLNEFMTGHPLPKSHKEAVMILSEKEPDLIGKWNIDPETIKRYSDFKEFYSKNSRRSDLRQRLRSKFGDTYWLYYLYNQNK